MKKWLATLAATVIVALGGLGVGAAGAAYVYGYSAAGEWFSPGEGYGSVYDHFCGPWIENNFSKGGGSLGLITFIDGNGNWNYTVKGTGWIKRGLSVSSSRQWSKKLHCKNHSGATYQGGCYGFREPIQNCV